MSLPTWAKAPGPDWQHRDNYSDVDVVWYHGPTNEIVYQLGADHYVQSPAPAPTAPRRWLRTRRLACEAARTALVATAVYEALSRLH